MIYDAGELIAAELESPEDENPQFAIHEATAQSQG